MPARFDLVSVERGWALAAVGRHGKGLGVGGERKEETREGSSRNDAGVRIVFSL